MEGDIVGIALTVAMQFLLVASFALFMWALFIVVYRTRNPIERAIRALAMFAGAMVVIAAQASGASYADFIVDSLGGVKPLTFGLAGVVMPGVAGGMLAWYMVRAAVVSEVRAVRLLAFVGMLAGVQYLTLYGVSLGEKGFELSAAALPNMAFVIGIALYVMFQYDPEAPKGRMLGSLGSILARGDRRERPNPDRPSLR